MRFSGVAARNAVYALCHNITPTSPRIWCSPPNIHSLYHPIATAILPLIIFVVKCIPHHSLLSVHPLPGALCALLAHRISSEEQGLGHAVRSNAVRFVVYLRPWLNPWRYCGFPGLVLHLGQPASAIVFFSDKFRYAIEYVADEAGDSYEVGAQGSGDNIFTESL